uniref:Uncharacterized protein n=1 Tax=Salmonella phage vB_SE130_2P TaxID=3236707 RepID=A0AB39C4N6_9VIRU
MSTFGGRTRRSLLQPVSVPVNAGLVKRNHHSGGGYGG